MEFVDFVDTADQLYDLTHIPLCIFNRSGKVFYCCLAGEESPLPKEYMNTQIDLLKKKWNEDQLPYMCYTESGFFLGLMALDKEYGLLAGPTPDEPLEPSTFEKMNQRYIRLDQIRHMQRICDRSSLASEYRFAKLLAVAARLMRGKPCSPDNILKNNFVDKRIRTEERPDRKLNDPKATTPEMVVSFINRLRLAIRTGNQYTLDEIWQSDVPMNLKVGSRHENEDKLIYIPLISTLNNTALDSGADQNKCFEIINDFTEQLQNATLNADAFLLIKHASYDFCRLVKNAENAPKQTQISSDIEKYIIRHIGESISAADIADAFSISKRQVFRIFQTDFKMSLTEYVTKEKLRRAAILLKTGRYTLAEISDMYGFASQSYFTKRFSELYGTTPGKYRKTGKIDFEKKV